MPNAAKALVLMGTVLASAAPASAATLTLTDTFGGTNTIWTLTVQTGCLTCNVTLSGLFQDPDGPGGGTNAYAGKWIDSVQWVIEQPNVNPTSVGFLSTNAGTATNWDFDFDESLSGGNQCNGGAQDAICGEWTSGGIGDGFQAQNGATLNWNFEATFDSALPDTLVSGNIRAAFNNANGRNFNVFSPGGGAFDTSSTTVTGSQVPEPSLLALLGAGLVLASRRLRRAAG
jgi:hypothetical protein